MESPEVTKTPTEHARLNRRSFLKAAGGAAVGVALVACGSSQGSSAGSAPTVISSASKDVVYDGKVFDAGGATLRIADWGGPWQDLANKYLLDQFQKDFNCKIQYDSSWPWFPKYAASGPKSPAFDVTNWNLPELYKTAKAGDYFVPIDELKANVPTSKDLYDFAYRNGHGITYVFTQYGYAYRKDKANPAPKAFKDFWADQFKGARATYITSNTLQMVFFMVASSVFGKDDHDMQAGFKAMQDAMPMKISDFTGNMQTLLERGEATIAVLDDGEAFQSIDKGVPLDFMYWTEKQPILTQTMTVSRYSQPIQKKLGYALITRATSSGYLDGIMKEQYQRPTNKTVQIPQNLASKNVTNAADAAQKLWIPDWNWYLDNEQQIVEKVNQIFGK